MNIAKHMEAVFVAATLVLCSYAYQGEAIAQSDAAVQQIAADTEVQTVVITAKRGA